jgi:hypothetical protein
VSYPLSVVQRFYSLLIASDGARALQKWLPPFFRPETPGGDHDPLWGPLSLIFGISLLAQVAESNFTGQEPLCVFEIIEVAIEDGHKLPFWQFLEWRARGLASAFPVVESRWSRTGGDSQRHRRWN